MSSRPIAYITPLEYRNRIARAQPLGLPLINMALNELPFSPPEPVAAAIAETSANVNRYGNPRCNDLLERISERFNIPIHSLICGNGSEELLDVIARNFVRANDEIVISEYGYIVFEMIAKRLNAHIRKAKEHNYTSHVDSLLETITPATRLLFLANPNNPTGTFLPAAELERLAEEIPAQVVLVIDLAYAEFVGFDYCSRIHRLVEQKDNVIVTRTFSKAFALAGLRVGWAHAPQWMISGLYAARGMGTVNAVAQSAAIASLQELSHTNKQILHIISERTRLVQAVEEAGMLCIPSNANFVLMTIKNSEADLNEQLVESLFDSSGIIVTLARERGLENFIRVSVSMPNHNDSLIEVVKGFIKQSRGN